MTVCVGLQVLWWFKLIAYLKLTHRYGFMTKIIELMVIDLINFMVLFCTIIIGFATVLFYFLQGDQPDAFNICNKNIKWTILIIFLLQGIKPEHC